MTGKQEMIHDNGFADAQEGIPKQSRGKWYLIGYRFGLACKMRDDGGHAGGFTQLDPATTMQIIMENKRVEISKLTFGDIALVYPEMPLVAEGVWQNVLEARTN